MSDATGDSEYVHRELRWHLRDAQFERLGPPAALRQTRHNHKVLERHLQRAGHFPVVFEKSARTGGAIG